jgi:small subunit ribosomal protein S24e
MTEEKKEEKKKEPAAECTIRTRKFMSNRLLQRRQMIVDVVHPGRANVSKAELQAKIATMYRIKDPRCVVLYGFRTAFGGGRSTGFCLIYDNLQAVKDFEPKHRQIRAGLMTKNPISRKQRKERKNKAKAARGKKKREILKGTATAQPKK